MPNSHRPAMFLIDTHADPRLQLMSVINVPLCLVDTDHMCIAWANDSAVSYWESPSAHTLCSQDLSKNFAAADIQHFEKIKQNCIDNKRTLSEQWTTNPESNPKTANFECSAFQAPDDRWLLLLQVVDSGAAVDPVIAYSSAALKHTSAMISAFDENLQLIYGNFAARNSMPEDMKSAKHRLANLHDIHNIINTLEVQDSCETHVETHTLKGLRWHSVHVQRCTNPTSGQIMYLITENDITEQRKAQKEAYRLAFTDTLTGLPNRAALNQHLKDLLQREESHEFAIFFLDLNRFKIINDSLGHAVGDQLLIDVAQRLRQGLGKAGSVYRLGGDEFVMLATKRANQRELQHLAEQILLIMANPVTVSGHKLRVLPSIGICRYPTDGTHLGSLMENADAAMYIAKADQCGYCFYDAMMSSSITENVKERMGLENDLIYAIENDEFELYFQPKISCQNLAVQSVEALIRWNHPARGMVPPDKFIGIAEETGQIVDLGNWVLTAAMNQQRRWHEKGLTIPVSVNISARQFSANDLLANVSEALRKTNCDPQMIELEITESMLVGEPDAVFTTLQALSAMGIKLALDDFGTGYSNLAYLQKYPLDILKIDKIFLADRKRSLLMGTILNMGKVLGLQVIAEGVETSAQADWLISHGCDLMQGYYFCKPMQVASITQYLYDNEAPGIDGSQAA